MIGQTMINVKASRARTRISTFLAGTFLLVLVLGFSDLLVVVPMAALVAVMISIRPSTLKMMPKSETAVMVSTVIVIVWTHNLAIGVAVGVLVAMVAFARRVAHFVTVTRTLPADEAVPTAHYRVIGALFFASSNDLTTQFEYTDDPDRVIIDMTESHIWDASTVAALDAIVTQYEARGKCAIIEGLNAQSLPLHGRLAGNLGTGH